MREEDRILLFMGWSILLFGIIFLICRVTVRMDQLDKKINKLYETEITTTEEPTTEAHIEPSDDEIVISLRPEYTSERALEASEEVLTVTEEQLTTEESKRAYLGSYELTAYEWTGNPCANGNYPSSGYTVACNSLPLGTRIYIEGYGEYMVEDRGGMADNVIDIYMGDYDSCIQFGRRVADVYIIE